MPRPVVHGLRSRAVLVWSLAVGCTWALTACTGAPDNATTAEFPHLESIHEAAVADGSASDHQLELLATAAAQGTLPFDDYAEAVDNTLACFEDAGITYLGPTVDPTGGIDQLAYAAQVGFAPSEHTVPYRENGGSGAEPSFGPVPEPTDSVDPLAILADDCRNQHSKFVEWAYSEQPSSLEAQDTYLEGQRESVLACAKESGLALDEDLPIRQLLADLIDYGEAGRQCLGPITAF